MKNLISMVDFVLEQSRIVEESENFLIFKRSFCKIENYAHFLKQPLELWMFDENDERCLFESENKYCFETILLCKKTIEDITNFNFKLTKTALKQIGL